MITVTEWLLTCTRGVCVCDCFLDLLVLENRDVLCWNFEAPKACGVAPVCGLWLVFNRPGSHGGSGDWRTLVMNEESLRCLPPSTVVQKSTVNTEFCRAIEDTGITVPLINVRLGKIIYRRCKVLIKGRIVLLVLLISPLFRFQAKSSAYMVQSSTELTIFHRFHAKVFIHFGNFFSSLCSFNLMSVAANEKVLLVRTLTWPFRRPLTEFRPNQGYSRSPTWRRHLQETVGLPLSDTNLSVLSGWLQVGLHTHVGSGARWVCTWGRGPSEPSGIRSIGQSM